MINILLIALVLGSVSGDPFKYSDCGSESGVFKINTIKVAGDPVVVGPKNPVVITSDVDVYTNLTNSAILSLNVYKGVKLFGRQTWVEVPCIDGYGSCKLSMCDFFKKFENVVVCPFLKAIGKPCECPLPAGSFVGKNVKVTIDLSEIPQAILNFGNGDLKVHSEITLAGKMIVCLELYLTVKLDQASAEINVIDDGNYNPFWNGNF